MARPRKENRKDNRIPLRIDDALNNAITEFMSSQGLPNRNEAIRELISMGILQYYLSTQDDS
jgi:metal-responsive CopG/Arc/MetJ family transcriptional regulator